MPDQSLGAGYGCTEDTPCRLRDAGRTYVLAWLSPDGAAGKKFVKLAQTRDIF